MYLNGKFVFGKILSEFDNRSMKLISDEEKQFVNVDDCDCCSKSSLIEHKGIIEDNIGGTARVNVIIDEGGELVRLKEIEFDNKWRCFCVEAIVGRAKRGGDDDEHEDEQVESVVPLVLERDNVIESLLITGVIVCIAESVSLSIFCCCCWDINLSCDQVFIKGLLGLIGGGVGLLWLVILSQIIIGWGFLLDFFELNGIGEEVSTTTIGGVRGEFPFILVPSHCLTKTLRIGEETFVELFINKAVWDSNWRIIFATRDKIKGFLKDWHPVFVGDSASESNDCEGRKVDDDDGGSGAGRGRRKKGFDCLLLLLFVVKSFTDVHRWMNVDDDIFFSSLSLSFFFFFFFVCSIQNSKNDYSNEPLTMLISIIDDNDNNNIKEEEEEEEEVRNIVHTCIYVCQLQPHMHIV